MNYLINPWWFYWINVIDNFKTFCFIIAFVSGCGLLFSIFGFDFTYSEDFEKFCGKIAKLSVITLVLSVLITIFVPGKETLTQMMIASYVTEENIEYGKDQVKEIVDYIVEKSEEVKNSESE